MENYKKTFFRRDLPKKTYQIKSHSNVCLKFYIVGDNLKVVYGVKIKDVPDNFTKYYGLAVVKKGTPFNFTQLKGKNSCHTGIGRSAGWKIPVGYLLFTGEMTFTCSQYQSVANFFGKSCAPGRL